MSCRYAIGFYDDRVIEDKERRVSIRVLRPGLRAIHASNYVFRSPEAKHRSALQAAFAAPKMFQTGLVRAHVFPLEPASKRRWKALLAISFPYRVDPDEKEGREVDFRGVLRKGNMVAYKFDRRIRLTPAAGRKPTNPRRQITFIESVDLKPGSYELTTVLEDPEAGHPQSAIATVDLPPVPKRALFVVGPVLGREAGQDVVVRGPGSSLRRGKTGSASDLDEIGTPYAFEPLLVQRADRDDPLFAVTQVCLVGSNRQAAGTEVLRTLRTDGGSPVGSLPPIPLRLDGKEKIRCQRLLDVLPGELLSPGSYVLEVQFQGSHEEQDDAGGAVRFDIVASETAHPPEDPPGGAALR